MGDKGYYRLLRLYMGAVKVFLREGPVVPVAGIVPCSVTAMAVCSESPNRKHTPKRERTALNAYASKRDIVPNWKRRRLAGAGRSRRVMVVREMLLHWYNKVRHSVDVKIMCRFPKRAFLVKAIEFYQEYIVACLQAGEQPEAIVVNKRWVNDFLFEHRLSQRNPNRKWKVSRTTLKERLRIFWIMICKQRKLHTN